MFSELKDLVDLRCDDYTMRYRKHETLGFKIFQTELRILKPKINLIMFFGSLCTRNLKLCCSSKTIAFKPIFPLVHDILIELVFSQIILRSYYFHF